MKKYFILLCISQLTIPVFTNAQEKVNEDMYIDYQKYLTETLKVLYSIKEINAPSAKELQDSSAILVDEDAASVPIKRGN